MTQNNVQLQNGNGSLAGFRNQIINGQFEIWQRGTSFTSTGVSEYTADRWKRTSNVTGATVSRSTTAPAGFAYSIDMSSTGGSLQQGIELVEPNNNSQFPIGSTWTMSFWADVDVTSQATMVRFRQTVGDTAGQIEATAGAPNWSSTGETSNGFTRYQSTFTITGSASTSSSIVCLNVNLPSASALGTAYKAAGVQLEPGPIATPFERRPVGLELSLCQRYYEVVLQANSQFVNTTTGQSVLTLTTGRTWVTTKRVAPTVTLANVNYSANVQNYVYAGNRTTWSIGATIAPNLQGALVTDLLASAEL